MTAPHLINQPLDPLQYALNLVGEEATEISQTVFKAQRFGLLDQNPDVGESNLDALQRELSDLLASVHILNHELVKRGLPPLSFEDTPAQAAKIEKVLRYSTYSIERGTLTGPLEVRREMPATA